MIELDATNVCSYPQKKLFNEEGVYYPIWQAMQNDDEITAMIHSRQLHIYHNDKKVLVLPGKAVLKVIREDSLGELLPKDLLKWKK